MNPVVILDNISLAYGENQVLKGFDLEVQAGERVALTGTSSSGKSTIFKLIVGLITPDRGKVWLFGQDLSRASARALDLLRKRLSIQFQAGAMFDNYTVEQNLVFVLDAVRDMPPRPALNQARQILTQVGLKKSGGKFPYALSGGMRKRAAVARALTTGPELALFDEPAAGLDPVSSRQIVSLISRLALENKTTALIATTDMETAQGFADRLVVVNQGLNWAQGSLAELKSNPDPLVRQLLSRLLTGADV